MRTKKVGTFKKKIIALFTLIIAIISFLFFIYSVYDFKIEAKANFEIQIQNMKQLLLTDTENLLFSKDQKSDFQKLLKRIPRYNEINYIVIADSSGEVIQSFNLEIAIKNGYQEGREISEIVYEKKDVVNLILPVFNNGYFQGGLYFGISKEKLNVSINKAIIEYAMVFGGVIVLGFLFIIVASFMISEPFDRILKGANKMLKGEYSQKIIVKNKGEFTSVANTINAFAEKIEESDAQILHLNEKLNTAFRDKLGELNLEINQRRLAEDSLRKSEEQFRLLFDIAPIGMVISSPERKILKVNLAFERTLEYLESELIKLATFDITYYEDRSWDDEIYKDFLEGHIKSKNYEKRFVTKNGKIIDVVNRIILHRDEKGKPVQFIEQVIDITEQKKLQTDLVYAKEKAEESDRMKSAFLAQMSHEIRTPLNVILAASGIFEEELLKYLDDDSKEIVHSVKSAGRRLMRTIDLILNMSAIQTGKYKPEFENFDLNIEIKKLVEEFRTISTEKKLNLSFSSHTNSAIVKADKYTVQQIFQNLISNAIKYTKLGSVDVVVFRTDRIFVEIKDTGIGMSEEYQKNLFHSFSQEDVGQRREFEGNGLGLALVKKYIEINNADIKVKSEKEKGSTFTVIF